MASKEVQVSSFNMDFMEVFDNACSHIQLDYIDREFINNGFVNIKADYGKRVRQLGEVGCNNHAVIDSADVDSVDFVDVVSADIDSIGGNLLKQFENLMIQFVEEELTLSHCKFITPAVAKQIANQESEDTAPSFLKASYKETDDYCYLKIPTMTIPLFSWDYLSSILEKLVDDKRVLILDLRLNTGGSASATGELLTPFIGMDKPFLITRLADWENSSCESIYPFPDGDNHGNCLDVEAIGTHPFAQWLTLKELSFSLKQKPVLLIGERCYSCGEVFAQAMKEYNSAVIIGKTTAGAVVGAKDTYDCGYGYSLMLPFVDMVSKNEFMIEGKGVTPHIKRTFSTSDMEELSKAEIMDVVSVLRKY